jgi:hypothetical protein
MFRARAELAAAIVASACVLACGSSPQPGAGLNPVQKVYDKQTGRLNLLTFDRNKDGRIDTWCHMDGTRMTWAELDTDGDGKLDRWEYYGADQKLEKVGMSRANDGKVDAWAYSAADGTIGRIEVSTARDGKANRTEFYEGGALARAEEDSDADGRIDKWETFGEAGALTSVSLDTQHRGTPDRRLVYLPDGQVRTDVLK